MLAIRVVKIDELMSEHQLEEFFQADLPWTFGDTTLCCIKKGDLLNWLDDEESWKEVIKTVEAIPEDVLIALDCKI